MAKSIQSSPSTVIAAGLVLLLVPALGLAARGQRDSVQDGRASAQSSQKASAASGQSADLTTQRLDLSEGTKLSANLASTIDASTAKPGDQVVARVTKNIKAHGRTVIRKGDELVGHVTEVQAAGSGKAGSSVGIAFDRVVAGNSSAQLSTVLNSVVSTPSERQAQQQQMAEPALPEPMVMGGGSAAGAGRASSGGGGGLLGGVASTAGSATGTVGSTLGGAGVAAGSTVNSAAAAGSAAGVLGANSRSALGGSAGALVPTPRKSIHLGSGGSVNQQSTASSTLSTNQGNLRLDPGTELQFRVTGSATAN
ncbi:MAG TPA: hypothetical protein VKU44_07920 [Terriglobia bacterium]|nr:hypothetical protein [Terriglobia bacterium]